MRLKTIHDLKKLAGSTVLVRVDFNVPLKNGKVVDDFKIVQSIPTISYLLARGARVILMTHLGRPKGFDKKLSVAPLAKMIANKLGIKVGFVPYTKNWRSLTSSKLPAEKLILLENVRFYKEEEKAMPAFAKQLASLGDYFVFDGFAVAHRSAASVTGVGKYLPTYAGSLVESEVAYLGKALSKPKRPFVVVLGGAKVETKIPVLKALLPKADYILVGGGIANTYCAAEGMSLGSSLVGKEYLKVIKKYCDNTKVILPVDYVVGDQKGQNTYCIVTKALKLPKGVGIYDVGPATIQLFSRYLKKAQTIVWNGAMGRFEEPAYAYGTKALACLIAARSKGKAVGIVGGGETVEMIEELGLRQDIDWVSTGGGAMLDWLSQGMLPGVKQCLR